MPTRDLFEPSTEEQIRSRLTQLTDEKMREAYDRAEEYARGRMLDDVDRVLLDSYAETQRGGNVHEGVQPQAIPITQKFLEEAATLYTRPVVRELVDDEGNTLDEPTQALNRMLGEAGYDEAMHAVERRVVLMLSSGVWYQPRAGQLRVKSYSAHKVSPIPPEERTWFDPADQDDYQAFTVELQEPGLKGADEPGEFAYVERAQTVFYRGRDRNTPGGMIDPHPNPFVWPQVVDTDDLRGQALELPLQMMTAWHDRLPDDCILPDVDVPIVDLNRELNVQWSMLLDTIRHQGWTQLVANVNDPDSPPSVMQAGPRNVLVLGVGETMQAIDSATNYAGLVDVLTRFIQVVAQSKNLSPNDFALEGQTPASGFAKLLDALPKVSSRQKLGERMAAQEARIAWPRIAVIGRHLGVFSQSIEQLAAMRLRVKFADVEIPRSVEEETKREEFDLRHGLTTPARLLAAREGVTVEEAQQRIDEDQATEEGAPTDPATALNGAQVTSLLQIVQEVALGNIPRAGALQLIVAAFPVTEAQAEAILADAGAGFVAASIAREQQSEERAAARAAETQANQEPAAPTPTPSPAAGRRERLLGTLIGRPN